MILTVLIAFLVFALYRQAVCAAYVLNWLADLLYVIHSDGVTFQYLWPGNPARNSFASIPLVMGIIIMSPMFARVFLNTRLHHPLIDRLLWAVILFAAFSRFKEVRFFVIAWAGFLGAAMTMTMRHWLGMEISQNFQNDAIRSGMVVDAKLTGLSIEERNNQLRQSRQKALV